MLNRRRQFALRIFFATASVCNLASQCLAFGFTDVTVAAGVNYTQWQPPAGDTDLILHMSGGAAAGDFDNDGWVDLFVTRLDGTDILYRNLGNTGSPGFQDVSASAGFHQSLNTNGATWGDVDNDGDQDLYVTTLQDTSLRNHLYINNGSGAFTEEGVARGADLTSSQFVNGFSSAFGDYDGDGYLDLYTAEWNPDSGVGNSRLLRNLGAANPGNFEDVTIAAGVDVSVGHPVNISYAFAPNFADMDRDGLVDLVIAGDFGGSRLFWNNGDGTFSNGTVLAGVGTDENGMGSAIGDYDGDGDLDWFVSSIYEAGGGCGGAQVCGWGDTGNRLFQNNGDRTFTDATDVAGVREGGWGWGSAWLDYDNDGDLDLTHTNGVDFPGETKDAPFVNDQTRFWANNLENGNGGVFSDIATQIGITDEGSGKGLLTFDYDNDGDLDLFIVNNSGQPVLYRNDGGNANDWLRIKTVGSDSNTDGIGAQITVVPNDAVPDDVFYHEVNAGSNFLGQNDVVAHFGLGDLGSGTLAETIDRVTIEWPATGIVQVLEDVTSNTLMTVTEPASADWNHDGVVDASDYAVWNAGYAAIANATHTDGDGNNDADVDGGDLLTWQRHYGNGVTAVANSTAVPEPSSCTLLLAGGLLVLRRVRFRGMLGSPLKEFD